MISISDKPHKKTEFFNGTIYIAYPNCEKIEWEFTLLRHTNGSIKYSIQVHDATPEQEQMIAATILANIEREQVNWRPL